MFKFFLPCHKTGISFNLYLPFKLSIIYIYFCFFSIFLHQNVFATKAGFFSPSFLHSLFCSQHQGLYQAWGWHSMHICQWIPCSHPFSLWFVHLFMQSFSTHLWSNHTVLAAAVGSGKGPQTGAPSSESFHLGPLGCWNQLTSALSSVQSLSRVPTLCDPLNRSTPGLSPSPTAGVYPNPCPLSQWCHPTISSSVVPFSSCPQSFPASGSFQMSQLFASDGQSTGVLASTSFLPMNIQDCSPLGWSGWISLQSKGLSRVFSNTTVQKHQFFGAQLSL